jgi:hypothetical protein
MPAQANCLQDPISKIPNTEKKHQQKKKKKKKIPNTKKGWQRGSGGRIPA